MTLDSPDSHFAPDSEENFLETGTFRKHPEISRTANLSDIQLRAIDLLLQGYNDTQTAQLLSISPRTLWNWKNRDDDYREHLAEARHQLHATVTDRLESIVFKATATLLKFLDDPTDASRMKAAQILLSAASRYKPEPSPKRLPTPTQKEIANYYFPPPDLGPKVG
jgi:hypothetical protein